MGRLRLWEIEAGGGSWRVDFHIDQKAFLLVLTLVGGHLCKFLVSVLPWWVKSNVSEGFRSEDIAMGILA